MLTRGVFATLLVVGGLFAIASQAVAQTKTLRATAGPFGTRGKHCNDEQKRKLMLEHFMGGSINPLGIENQLILTYCLPFVEKPGILWDYTKLEFGLANYISPTHFHIGPTVRFAPLSFLILRAELTGFYIWPIPLQGAGYIEVQGYDDFKAETVKPALGVAKDMFGLRTALGVTLQGALPLGKWVDILIVNGLTGEFWRAANGDFASPFWYIAKLDGIMDGRGDWALVNNAALIVSIKPHKNHAIRIGATDNLLYIPGSGYKGNIAAGILAWSVSNLRDLAKSFAFFMRVGTFTHHAFRSGITLAAGLDVTYELSSTPTRRAEEEQQAAPTDAATSATTTLSETPAAPAAQQSPTASPAPADATTTPAPEGQK
ncbi:MAG TPA: hypothetical protein PLY80_13010 [Pseudomonadota bacterium]|jgi:hypothetical protein|nr:hypothetical protein [Pseudomonadota bacterium]HNI60149.1 hypothetical protein [Pseudomonadota bacterium]